MGDEKPEEPKIIVDDDWKSQVAAEKEKLRKEVDKQEKSGGKPQMPPASFATLLSMLATQVMASLGQFPDPTDGKTHVDKVIAKHLIDTIAMLEEKTKGNLSEDEAKMLDELLHQMRILFVSVREKPAEAEKPKSKIELP